MCVCMYGQVMCTCVCVNACVCVFVCKRTCVLYTNNVIVQLLLIGLPEAGRVKMIISRIQCNDKNVKNSTIGWILF